MKLTDHHKRVLTEEVLGECWHEVELRQNAHYPESWFHCDGCQAHFPPEDINIHNRTFTTDDDMLAVYRALFKKEMWEEFVAVIGSQCNDTITPEELNSVHIGNLAVLMHRHYSRLAAYLFCLSSLSEIEGMMVRVAEWWGKK